MKSVGGWSLIVCLGSIAALGSCGAFDGEGITEPTGPISPGDGADADAPVNGVPAKGFELQALAGRTFVVQGRTTKVQVRIKRGPQFVDPVDVRVTGTRDGITVAPLTIAAGQSEGELVVQAPLEAPQGPMSLTMEATAGTSRQTRSVDAFVRGPSGTLDTTFATAGKTDYLVGAEIQGGSLLFLPDDRIVAAVRTVGSGRQVTVFEFSKDGVLDATFGDQGKVVTSFKNANPSLAQQSDGKLLVGGQSTSGVISRLLANGSLDTAFGVNGVQLLAPAGGTTQGVENIVVRADGAIFAVFRRDSGTTTGIVRLTTSGAVETSFGTFGYSYPIISNNTYHGQPFVLSGGTLLATGIAQAAGGQWGYGAVLVNANTGNPESTYGSNGVAFQLAPSSSIAMLRPYLAPTGGLRLPFSPDLGAFSLAAFSTDGKALDSSFGNGGISGPFGTHVLYSAVAYQADGRIVVATEPEIVRLTPSGALDPTFGQGGRVLMSAAVSDPVVWDIGIQSDARIVVLAIAGVTELGEFRARLFRLWD